MPGRVSGIVILRGGGGGGGGPNHALVCPPASHVRYTLQLLREDAALYLSELLRKLKDRFGDEVIYDKKRVSRELVLLRWTKKKLVTMATQQDMVLRGRFKTLMCANYHPGEIIWIDEMHKGWAEMGRRRRGRAKKGRKVGEGDAVTLTTPFMPSYFLRTSSGFNETRR